MNRTLRRAFFLLAFLCVPGPVAGQTGTITGTAKGPAGEPLAAATVEVLRDSVTVASVTTGDNGRFRVTLVPFGRYRVAVSFLGHTTATRADVEVSAGAPAAELGDVLLDLAPVELEAIEAQAERSAVQILTDRTVYTTKEMPASTGGTATDLLREVPELEVDINGNVKLRGNQGVAIHINGRPAPLRGDALNNFLQQMPADRIAKVEVMPNPTAKHDPEGTGGIVNLVLIDNVDLGLSGNLTGRYGTRGSRGLNGRVAYQKGRLTLFGGVGLNDSDSEDDMFDVRQNLLATPITILEQEGLQASDYRFAMFDLTTEVKVAEKTTAWLQATGYGQSSTNSSDILYGLYDADRYVLDRYDRLMETEGDGRTSDVAVGFKHVFRERHELTFDVRRSAYGFGSTTNAGRVPRPEAPDPLSEVRRTDNDSDNRGLTLRVDYTRPLGEKGKIDAGINIGRRDLTEYALLEVRPDPAATPDEHTETEFAHDEDFNSAYLTVAQTWGDLGVQLGLRAEAADTRLTLFNANESFDNDYRSLFPSVNLSYTIAQGQTARLNYSKRISRPWTGMLNPYVPTTDPLNQRVGNPYLLPSYTHSFSLDYSWIGTLGTLRVAPFYRRSTDGWEQIKRVDADGVSTVTWENSASTESLGSSTTLSVRPNDRLNATLNVGVYRYDTDASNISPEYSRTSWRYSLGGNATYRVTQSLNAQVSGNFSPARDVPQGRVSAMFYSSLSLRQQLLSNRATISLFVTDPLDLYDYTVETRDRTHVQNSRTGTSLRSLSLSFTFNFGKPPQQVSRREGGTATEEQGRIR